MNSLFLPTTVWRFECKDGVSWWAQKALMLRASKLYEEFFEQKLERFHVPEGAEVLSLPELPYRSKYFNVMYVKRVPVDTRW